MRLTPHSTTTRPRPRHAAVVAACLGWALTLTACNHHPLAQWSGREWSPRRVVVADPAARDARVRPVKKAGFYALVREWDPRGRVSDDAARPGRLIQTYLDRGELLGFRRAASPPGSGADAIRAVAVFGDQDLTIRLDPGVHHVWYRERGPWSDAGASTFLLGVLGIAVLVGLIFVVAESDDSSVNINVN